MPLWVAALLLGTAVFPLLLYSGHLYYADGGKSPDAPGMVFESALFTAPVWLGGWLMVAAPYLLRYVGRAPVVTGLGDTFTAILLSLLAFAGSAFFLWLVLARIDFWRPSRLPFVVHLFACAAYLQFLRAAAVRRSRT